MKIRTIIAFVFAFALLAGACGDDDGGPGSQYSPAIRDSYLQGCGGSQNAAFCECTLAEIEKRFSEADFIKFAIEATEEAPQEFVDIAFACLSEADLGG